MIVVHIPPGMPHVYALDGRYLSRQGIENTALKPRELRRLIIERGELSFETEIAHGTSLEDIDWDKAKAYVSTLGGINEAEVETALFRRGCLTRRMVACARPTPEFCCSAKTRSATFAARRSRRRASPATP